MKIDVIIPSRGNPLRLMAVLTCFDALATGDHDITYRVVCDMDDPLTWKAVSALPGMEIAIHAGEGPLSARMNEAAREGDADVVTGAADDTFPLAQHWDGLIAVGIEGGHPAFSWQEVNDPANTTMLVFSRRWLDAIGRMLPEYFPFWFGDTWVAEVYEMAYQRPLPIATNLPWGGKRGKTKGMRDLAFWFDFFAATREERLDEARELVGEIEINPAMLADMKKRDIEQLERVPQFNEWFGADQGEPSALYLSTKARAEAWLAEHVEKPCLIVMP